MQGLNSFLHFSRLAACSEQVVLLPQSFASPKTQSSTRVDEPLHTNALQPHGCAPGGRYGVIPGIGIGLCYSAPFVCAMRWLPEHRGLVSGFVVAESVRAYSSEVQKPC